jgi:phage/plasmid-associated DNA primase
MKTTWELYVSEILKDKCMSMAINFFTMGKGGANSATPAEIRREGSRLMFSEEPEGKVPFMVSIVKSTVGNDKQPGRGLYEETRDIKPQDKVVVVCNYPPPIAKEPATEERVIVLEFSSQVSYDAPKDKETQDKTRIFPRDPLFDRKLPSLIDAGLWIMVQIYPLYSREGISNRPQSIIDATKAYWDSIDKYTIFVEDNLIIDQTDSLEPFTLYGEFHRWHERVYKRMDMPDRATVMKEFVKKLGIPSSDGTWSGWGMRKKPKEQANKN